MPVGQHLFSNYIRFDPLRDGFRFAADTAFRSKVVAVFILVGLRDEPALDALGSGSHRPLRLSIERRVGRLDPVDRRHQL